MSRALRSLAALAAIALGFAVIAAALAAVDPASGAVVLAAAATVAIALHLASIAPAAPTPLCARPRAPIDVSVLVAQSDPDAAGHPRPRAPGRVASPTPRRTGCGPSACRGQTSSHAPTTGHLMDPFAFPPVAAVLRAASTALTGLTEALSPIAGASAAALAVVLVTLLVRAALIPAGVAQARAEQIRARLAPKLREIRARHAKDPERLQRETMRIYAEAGASPLAGCLPMLAQMPVVAIIYGVFLHAEIAGGANTLLTHELWGVSLGASAAGALARGAIDVASAALFGAISVVLLAVGETTRRLFRIPVADDGPDLRWLGMLQFATAAIAMFVPLAAALYLVITTVWTLVQRLVLRRLYPLDG